MTSIVRPQVLTIQWSSPRSLFCVSLWILLALQSTNGFFVQQSTLSSSPVRDVETYCRRKTHNEVRCWELQRLRLRRLPRMMLTTTATAPTKTCLRESSTGHDIETPMKVNGDSHAYLTHATPLHHVSTTDSILVNGSLLGQHANGNGNGHGHGHGEKSNLVDSLSVVQLDNIDVPMPTVNGGFTHTQASKDKIGAANKGKTPWNKGRQRSEEEKTRIAAGVRARNRERFLEKLKDMDLTEEEYDSNKKEQRRKKEAERRSRRTEKGGYRPTEETKAKISKILKEKHANGEIKRRATDPTKVRRGFTHSEETKMKISESLRQRWSNDADYRARMTTKMKTAYSQDDIRQKVSRTLKKKWQDVEFREQMLEKMRKNRSSPEVTDEYRDKISRAMKAKWQDPEYREKTLKAIAKHNDTVERITPKRKPSKPRGSSPSEAQMMKPLTPRESGKKTLKKKPSRPTGAKASIGHGEMVRAVSQRKGNTKSDDPAKKKKIKKEKSNEPEGSVNRLREERRDLFDLLYGDEKFDNQDHGDTDDDDGVDSLLDWLPARFDLGDEDLDSFDPYGLDDY